MLTHIEKKIQQTNINKTVKLTSNILFSCNFTNWRDGGGGQWNALMRWASRHSRSLAHADGTHSSLVLVRDGGGELLPMYLLLACMQLLQQCDCV